MNQWTRARWWSFGIHVAFVSIPFVASSASALLFWHTLFGSWWLAVPMVAIIDILALTGLVLYIAGIPSPFVPLRHVLPFVSVVPLGVELYGALAHNGMATATLVTLLVTAIIVTIARQCFRTIELLFVSPVEAAREKAREQTEQLRIELAKLHEANTVIDRFALDRIAYHAQQQGTVRVSPPASQPAPPQLPAGPTVRHLADGYVYILRSADGYYKIGRAKDVQARVKSIAAFVPFAVEIVHTIQTDNMVRLERGLHRAYEAAEKRVNGEWFRLSDDDIELLRSLGDELAGESVEDALEVVALLAAPQAETIEIPNDPLLAKKRLAAQMRADRKPWREIAEAVGRSPATVRGWLETPAKEETQ
jgi:hypothetical protein